MRSNYFKVFSKLGAYELLFTPALLVSVLCAFAMLGAGARFSHGDLANYATEPNVYYGIIKVMRGLPLYTDPTQPPFDIIQYTPLYYFLTSGIAAIAGISASDVASIAGMARSVSVVLGVLVWAEIFILCRLNRVPVIFSVIFSCSAYVLCGPWFCLVRPDVLETFFTLSVILVFSLALVNPKWEGPVISFAALLSVLAVLSKQNGVHIVLATGVFLAFSRKWKQLILYCFLGIVWCAVVVIATAKFSGADYWSNIVEGVSQPVSLLSAFIYTYQPFFSQLAIYAALSILITRDLFHERTYLIIAMWTFLCLALFTGLKAGSGDYYFNDYLIAVSVLIPVYLFGPGEGPSAPAGPEKNSVSRLAILVLLFLIIFLPFRTAQVIGKITITKRIVEDTFQKRGEIVRFLGREINAGKIQWFYSNDAVLGSYFPANMLIPQPEVAEAYPGTVKILHKLREMAAQGQISMLAIEGTPDEAFSFGIKIDDFKFERKIGKYQILRRK
jgi:hypothetical protein